MTEVPDFLLQRSQDRRRALGLPVADGGPESAGGADPTAGGSAAPKAALSATAIVSIDARALAVTAPEPLEVMAERTRKKPPAWASAALLALPLWAFLYVALLGETVVEQTGALALGQTIFEGSCASCHGASGGGGVGPAFTNGEVILTFPEIEAHVAFVEIGGVGRNGEAYGDPARPGGQHTVDIGGMPSFAATLSPAELYSVVRYEREVLSGEELSPEAVAERDAHFDELGGGSHG